MTAQRRAAVAAYIALGMIWGFSFLFMHMAAAFISPAQTTLLRVAFGAVPVLVFALVTRSLAWRHLRHFHHFAVQAVLAAGLYYYAYAAGTARLDSGIAGALSGSIPLFATTAAVLVFRTEPLTTRKATAVVAGAVGVTALARPWAADEVDMAGLMWMLLGSASLGASFGYTRRFISPLGVPAAAAVSYQMLLAVLGLTMVTDLSGITAVAHDPAALLGVTLGLGVGGTGFAFVCYYVAVAGLGALTASTATYIPPVVAIIIGVGLLGEPLHAVTIVAVALILCAAVLTQKPSPSTTRQERREKPTPETVTARPQE
ncbi:DMT family transporter [Streptomyces rubiginosohelvolus]|uniref:DMT family transporter n=1 Tax=Streptomyces rubiginosohelvolus TaxID=67362 RepID=UPI0037A15E0B